MVGRGSHTEKHYSPSEANGLERGIVQDIPKRILGVPRVRLQSLIHRKA